MSANKKLFPILLVNFIGTLGFSIVIPFLVFLVTRFGGNAVIYGLLGSVYPAFQLIGAPILGRWSDVYGRRKILLLSQAGTAAAWVLFLAALYLPIKELAVFERGVLGMFVLTVPLIVLFLARALDGITGGNISVANAYLVDITDEADRSKNFGRMSVSANLGFILGPAVAGLLGATILGETLPVITALVISVIAMFIIVFYLPESNARVISHDREAHTVRKTAGGEHKECYNCPKTLSFRAALNMKGMPFMFLMYFLIFLGFNMFYTAFPIHALQGLEWTVTQMGIFFSVLSGMMVIVQGPILAHLTKICRDGYLVLIGSLFLAVNFIFIISNSVQWIYFAAVLFALGNGLMWPSISSILSKRAGEIHQGAIQGFASSFSSLASIVGLIAGGFLYNAYGAYVFLFSAAIIFIVFVFSFRFVRK